MSATASADLPGLDMAALIKSNPELDVKPPAPESKVSETPKSMVEESLSTLSTEEMFAKPEDARFKFLSLLSKDQQDFLNANSGGLAEEMVENRQKVFNFGAPVLEKMNQASINLLNEQKNIKIPEADQIVNNLLREMDGYNARYRSEKFEGFTDKIRKFFGGAKYSIKTMIRDAKPISDRLDEAEKSIYKMELDLENNGARAASLHKSTLETMDEVVGVLATLEAVNDYLQEKFQRIDAELLKDGSTERVIEFEGERYSLQSFREVHAKYAEAIGTVEEAWHDWRTQFFLGFSSAPTLRNLITVSNSMQRRLIVFRTQGIPQARFGLAMWQQAALAKQGAELGDTLARGTNQLISESAKAAADAVKHVSMAAKQPLLTEDTIFTIIDSVKSQAESLVAADKWGREVRAKTLAAFQRGEQEIQSSDIEGRRALAEGAIEAARKRDSENPEPPAASMDLLSKIGINA